MQDKHQIFIFYYTTKPHINQKSFHIPPPLATTNLHFVYMDLHILDISGRRNNAICTLVYLLLSFSIMFSRFIHFIAQSVLHSFLWQKILPQYGYNAFCLFSRQLRNIWIVSMFGYYKKCYYECQCKVVMKSNLCIFFLYTCAFSVNTRKQLPNPRSQRFMSMLSSNNFIV